MADQFQDGEFGRRLAARLLFSPTTENDQVFFRTNYSHSLSINFASNEFFFAFNLTAAGNSTVPIFMLRFVTSKGFFWAKLAASRPMAVLPIVLLGWVAQRQLVRGLSMGAVK